MMTFKDYMMTICAVESLVESCEVLRLAAWDDNITLEEYDELATIAYQLYG